METDKEKFVRVDGIKVGLGTEAEFKQASLEITQYTGGSSLGGAMSMLWGFLDGDRTQIKIDHAKEIAEEALEFQSLFGGNLSQQANKLLSLLALMPSQAQVHKGGKTRRKPKTSTT